MANAKKSAKKVAKKTDAGEVIAAKSSSVSFGDPTKLPGLTETLTATR